MTGQVWSDETTDAGLGGGSPGKEENRAPPRRVGHKRPAAIGEMSKPTMWLLWRYMLVQGGGFQTGHVMAVLVTAMTAVLWNVTNS